MRNKIYLINVSKKVFLWLFLKPNTLRDFPWPSIKGLGPEQTYNQKKKLIGNLCNIYLGNIINEKVIVR